MTPEEAQIILNGPAQQSQDMTPEMASQLLAQGQSAPAQNESYMSFPEAVGRHALAGSANFGRSIVNLPNNLSGGYFPPLAPKDFDYYKALGVEENFADKLGVGLLEFAPFLGAAGIATKGANALSKLAGSQMLKQNVLAGAGYGGVMNEDNRLGGAALGGALGGAAHGLGLGAGMVGQGLSNAYAKSAIPSLVERAGQYVRGGLGDAESGAQSLKGAYGAQTGKTANLWTQAEEKAVALDSANMRPNAEPYNNFIEKFIKDKSALEPAKQAKYTEALDFAKEEAKNLAPQSYSGVIALRQNLNEILGNFTKKRNLDAPSRELKQFATDLKLKLNDVVGSENKNSPDALKDFYKTWSDANKATTRTKEFYQSPDAYGKLQPNRKLEGGLKVEKPEGSLMNEFLPGPSQTGTHGYEQLANLLGNKEAAKQGLRNYEFRDLGNKKDALDVYQKLSPAQREVMFDKDPRQLLDVAQQASQRFYPGGREKESLGMQSAKFAGYHLLPGALVGGGALVSGHDAGTALGIGAGVALGGKGLAMGLGRYAARHPEGVQRALARGERPVKSPGKYANPLFNAYFGGSS